MMGLFVRRGSRGPRRSSWRSRRHRPRTPDRPWRRTQWSDLIPKGWDPYERFEERKLTILDDSDPRIEALMSEMRMVGADGVTRQEQCKRRAIPTGSVATAGLRGAAAAIASVLRREQRRYRALPATRSQYHHRMKRNTRQRDAILNVLYSSGRSLSPVEIQAEASRDVPRLSLPTVYRQLKGLVEEGTLSPVELPGQSPRYEAPCEETVTAAGHHHHHFHCDVCERVFPIHACPGPMTDLAPQGFRVERHDLTLHGRCDRCLKRRPGGAEP